MLCSIFLLDENGLHLAIWRRRKPAEAYRQRLMECALALCRIVCSAYLRQPVFVPNIAFFSIWANFRAVVLQSGLRAAWSTPIMSHDGKVLGPLHVFTAKFASEPGEEFS